MLEKNREKAWTCAVNTAEQTAPPYWSYSSAWNTAKRNTIILTQINLISRLSVSTWALGAAFLLISIRFLQKAQMHIGSWTQTAPVTIEFVYQMSGEHQGKRNRHANSAEWDVHLNMSTSASHGLQLDFSPPLAEHPGFIKL